MMMDPQTSSSSSPTGGGGGAHQLDGEFPVGLRVLVVDDDPTCLKIIDHMLRKCRYRVTTCSRAVKALEILREKKGGFDVVLSDVYMPDMDGFKLLEHIGLEMDLPVIMMSADDGKDVVMKGVTHGARDYLIKPVSMEALKNIWQHAFRQKMRMGGSKDMENSGSLEESEKQRRVVSDDGDNLSSGNNEGSWKVAKRKKEGGEEEDEFEDREDASTTKKQRVVWSVDLHQQFVTAVNHLGVEKAVPKRILEMMKVPGLTRENVASHLQKYRLYFKRISPQQQGRTDASFSSVTDASYNSISSLDGFDLQALAASGQLSPQTLMTISSGQRRGTSIGVDMSTTDRSGFFDSDIQLANPSRIRPTMVQQVNNNQTNLIYGSSMEPRQLGQTQHVLRSYGNMGLQVSEGKQGFFNVPSSSLRTSASFPTGAINGHLSNSLVMQMNQQSQQISLAQQQELIQFSAQRQLQLRGQLHNGIPGHMLGKTGAAINGDTTIQGNYINASQYGTLPPAMYTTFQNGNLHVNSNTSTGHNSIGMIQEVGGLEALDNVNSLKREKEVIPKYDISSDLRQCKNQDWQLQNINVSYELGTKQGNIEFGSSAPSHQNFNHAVKDGSSRNTCTIRKEIVSVEFEHGDCVPQNLLLTDDSYQNELMSMIGRQQQVQVEPEIGMERYPFEA